MPKQLTYKGKPTAKSLIFSMWDDGDDGDDESIALSFGVSRKTVMSYRNEWRREKNLGIKKLPEIHQVAEPKNGSPFELFETTNGIVWRVPYENDLRCRDCPIADECEWWVRRGGYLGCEKVYEREILNVSTCANHEDSTRS